MRLISVALLALLTTPLLAQYGPPASTLEDAQFYVREIVRQIEPAMSEARDQAAVFVLVARATNRLAGKQPAAELDDARKMLDQFLEQRERTQKPLSKENLTTLLSVRKELELAQPPYAIPALRERLHHEFVHTLERQVLRNQRRLDILEQEWTLFMQRNVKPVRDLARSGVEETAKEQSIE